MITQDDSLQASSNAVRMKVDQQTDLALCKSQVANQLRSMYRVQALGSFDLYHDATLDEHIQKERFADFDPVIVNINGHLTFKP
jgi:hypothetical protein